MVDTAMTLTRPVLADRLPRGLVREAMLVVGVVGFTALMAQVSIPVPGSPVPVTGQTLAVLLSGAAVGPLRGFFSQALYVLIGIAGMPVFAGHSHGYKVLIGATGGYLVGFVLASALVGYAARRGYDRNPAYIAVAFLLGSALIYLTGVTWLAHSAHMSGATAIDKGLTPFIFGDVLKAVIAGALLPSAWRLVARNSKS